MNKAFKDYISLTNDASNYLRNKNYSEQTIYKYNLIWKKLRTFIFNNKHEELNQEIANSFLKDFFDTKNNYTLHNYRRYATTIRHLLEYKTNSVMLLNRSSTKVKPKLEGSFGKYIISYIDTLHVKKLSKKNIDDQTTILSKFLIFCQEKKILLVENINVQTIVTFINETVGYSNSRIYSFTAIIRKFTFYLFDTNIIHKDISRHIPGVRKQKGQLLFSYYNQNEVTKFLETIDRSTGIGKRNYAITLIIVKLGLRAGDVAKLSFDEVLWDKNLIALTQQKTKENLVLPLTADVGNAILDYIKYGRPKCDSRSIFIKHLPPYTDTMTNTSVSSVITNVIRMSGVKIGERRHGSHALRHSLASLLLGNDVSHHIITQILGHKSLDSKTAYLRIDLKSMRNCILSVPPIKKDFYEQGGGYFYE